MRSYLWPFSFFCGLISISLFSILSQDPKTPPASSDRCHHYPILMVYGMKINVQLVCEDERPNREVAQGGLSR